MTDTLDHQDADTGADDQINDAPPQDSEDIEALAIEAGWKPADQWKGDGHMPASQFLKHQVARAREKSDELKSLNKRMDKLARTSASIAQAQLREQREELEGKYADMVAANKPNEARRISQQIDQLEASDTPDDVAADFKARNASWFDKDDEATALAFGVCEREARKGTSYEEQLEKAEAAVKKRFPELFQTAEPAIRRQAPAVNAPSSRSAPARSREVTLQTLPPEAKRSLEGYLGKIDPKDTAKRESFTKRFISTYNEENGR